MIVWLIDGLIWLTEAVVGAASILTGHPPRTTTRKEPPDRPAS